MVGEESGVLRISAPESVFKVQVGNGPVVTVEVGPAWDEWCDIRDDKSGGDYPAQCGRLVERLGLGADHNKTEAMFFVRELVRRVGAIEKKVGGNDAPASPASTASIVPESTG